MKFLGETTVLDFNFYIFNDKMESNYEIHVMIQKNVLTKKKKMHNFKSL